HPAWDSPWGPGRPGWHAECVAMALSVFGPAMDVHAGGAELRFPHHAYHAAMAEAFTGVRPYARAWFPTGVVGVDGAKMAKSAGNLVLLDDLLAVHPAGAVRLMILDRPWAQGWDYRPALLDAAAIRLESLYRAGARNVPDDPAAVDGLRRLLATDLNVPAALDLAAEAGGATAPPPARLLRPDPGRRARPGLRLGPLVHGGRACRHPDIPTVPNVGPGRRDIFQALLSDIGLAALGNFLGLAVGPAGVEFTRLAPGRPWTCDPPRRRGGLAPADQACEPADCPARRGFA